VGTRLGKALDPNGPYDAIILAYAGLQRLDSLEVVCQVLTLDQMLPAPGQGALGIQCRDERPWLELVASITDWETETAVTAERAFLAGLGGGCALPIAAYATIEKGHLQLQGRITAANGAAQIDLKAIIPMVGCAGTDLHAAHDLGLELAHDALTQGAATLLAVTV
jgi:hydroxymethylbilane synthase